MSKLIIKKAKPSKQASSQIHSQHKKIVKLKKNVSQKSEITNFYHPKKRIVNNDSFEDCSMKMRDDLKLESEMPAPDQPIGWQTENTSIDCQLRIQCDSENNSQQSQDDTSKSPKRSVSKVDQILHEIFNKLHFDGQSIKEDDKDSGNEDVKEASNEFDALLEDSWAIKDTANCEFNELEKKLSQQAINQSKESGLSSFSSGDSNKRNVSPASLNTAEKEKKDDFKIPETPAKNSVRSLKLNILPQFNSTPKMVSRLASKMNQSLNFEDISPIKGEAMYSSLVNIKQESKRSLDESTSQESCGKKRAKVLFGQSVSAKRQVDEDELMDDSFDVLLSQIPDKVLTATSRSPINSNPNIHLKKNNFQPINRQQSGSDNKEITKFCQTILKPNNNINRNFVQSNTSSSLRSSMRSSMQTTRSRVESSIQFTEDESSIFVKERKSPVNNLNNPKIRPTYDSKSTNGKHQINHTNNLNKKLQRQSEDDLLMDDEADFICSQIV